jgi:hypothetical protein
MAKRSPTSHGSDGRSPAAGETAEPGLLLRVLELILRVQLWLVLLAVMVRTAVLLSALNVSAEQYDVASTWRHRVPVRTTEVAHVVECPVSWYLP